VRALIADDDQVTATLLHRALERWGLDVIVAHDGTEAWTLLQESAGIGLVILDWMMPGFDGPELCRRIRQEGSLAHLYVLLLTGRQSRLDVITGLEAGADDYLTKPFDPDELRARVHVGLRVLGLQERLAERVAELEDALSKVKQLRGLLPICSYCKSVRSDQDYWQQVEEYMGHHADVQFSHGICPPCFERVTVEWGLGNEMKT
jgi:sigma-B regulation protein RsbU (phosphoserine phosphatase)